MNKNESVQKNIIEKIYFVQYSFTYRILEIS